MSATQTTILSSGAEALNKACFCLSLDESALRRALEVELGSPGLAMLVQERCPFVFSSYPVFVSAEHVARMQQVISAIELVVALPAWQERVLGDAPPIARHNPGTKGAFFGYDFHIDQGSFGLIEINTNAGGAMLNAVLAKAQRACACDIASMMPALDSVAELEQGLMAMFINEWRLSGRVEPLSVIAIIDEAPAEQYLYPEFLLFQQLFERHGYKVLIAAPKDCEFRNGALWHDELRIDLVYNRLTDFMLEDASTAALREAYLTNAIVLTPHPRAHALYANKRNLALFTNSAELQALGAPAPVIEILQAGIPFTEVVEAANAERLWRERRKLFFKPASGFGSRAAYRGDKVTKRVWQEILTGDYVAQSLIQPGERTLSDTTQPGVLKFDLRNYVYDASVQWIAARLYRGQTTNFRTPLGGFAPVYVYPATL